MYLRFHNIKYSILLYLVTLNSFLFLLLGYVRGKVYQQKKDHTHNSPHDRH